MKALVHLAQTLAADVRVYLGGADVGMPQQLLNDAQVRAMLEQMRRKTVPQHVRRDIARNSCALRPLLYAQPECDGRKRRASFG